MNRLILLRRAARSTTTLCTRRRIATAIQPQHRASSLNTIFPSSISVSNAGAAARTLSSLNTCTNFYTPNIESKQQNSIVTLASFPFEPLELMVGVGVLSAIDIGLAKYVKEPSFLEKANDLRDAGNFKEAFACYSKSAEAEADCVESYFELGWFYLNGAGVKKDVEMGKFWLTKGAASGDKKSVHSLLLKKNRKKHMNTPLMLYFKLLVVTH